MGILLPQAQEPEQSTEEAGGPGKRWGHTCNAITGGRFLYVFGGYGKDNCQTNQVHVFDTGSDAWISRIMSGDWRQGRVIGQHLWVKGCSYLLDTLMWKELNTTGHILPPRAGHSAVSFGKIVFVYGGYTEAQKLYDDLYVLGVGAGPSARFSMAGDCLDPVRSEVLVFVGGCSRSLEALDDIYYLHTGLTSEHKRRLEKLPLREKLKLKCQEQNLTLGHCKALVQVGVSTSSYQPLPLSIYGRPGQHLIYVYFHVLE